mgnify:CR=1 FL=1
MKHTSKRLKELICNAPFEDFMIFEDSTNVCCPEWFDIKQLQKEYPEKFSNKFRGVEGNIPNNYPHLVSTIEDKKDILANWNNKFHKDLRKSIIDGDYRFCTKMCPHLNKVYTNPELPNVKLLTKKELRLRGVDIDNPYPKTIYFNFDKACNLKCPSCRLTLIHNGYSIGAEMTLNSIEKQFGKFVNHIVITGSGDPFYSNVFRNWLQNFDVSKYPKLITIFLVTNGNMFTPKIWKSINKTHTFIRNMEWSIDAGTKHTYENITRLNGKWDKLMDNMDFLASINHFDNLLFSFVVQKENYKEMNKFVDLVESKFKNSKSKAKVLFRAIQDWRHQTSNWFKDKDVSNPKHKEHKFLIEELKSVLIRPNVDSNLGHFLN